MPFIFSLGEIYYYALELPDENNLVGAYAYPPGKNWNLNCNNIELIENDFNSQKDKKENKEKNDGSNTNTNTKTNRELNKGLTLTRIYELKYPLHMIQE